MFTSRAQGIAQRTITTLLAGLFALLLALLSAASLVIAAGLVGRAQIPMGSIVLDDLFAAVGGLSWFERFGLGSASFVSGVLAVYLMLRAVGVRAPRASLHVLEVDERGLVAIDARGIETIAVQAALGSQGVLDARAEVRGDGLSAARIKVEIAVMPGVKVKEAGLLARDAVREAVEELVGIDLRDVSVKAHVLSPQALSEAL